MRRPRRGVRLAEAALLVLIGLTGAGFARDEAPRCRLVGWVRDSCSGRPIPFANVIVTGDSAGGRSGIQADPSGRFDIACGCGPAGVRVIALSYEWKRDSLTLEPARPETLRFELMPLRMVPAHPARRHHLPRGAIDLSNDVFIVTHPDTCP